MRFLPLITKRGLPSRVRWNVSSCSTTLSLLGLQYWSEQIANPRRNVYMRWLTDCYSSPLAAKKTKKDSSVFLWCVVLYALCDMLRLQVMKGRSPMETRRIWEAYIELIPYKWELSNGGQHRDDMFFAQPKKKKRTPCTGTWSVVSSRVALIPLRTGKSLDE